MAKTSIQKSKGKAPDSYRPNTKYVIGVKGSDKTLGFYGEHIMGDKANLKVVSKGQANRMSLSQAHDIIRELKYKWAGNVYTLFKFS